MGATKDLWKSKTFWAGVLANIIGLLQLAGAITAADGQLLQADASQVIEGLFMVVSGVGAIYGRVTATDMIKRGRWLPF